MEAPLRPLLSLCTLLVSIPACATVDPGPDFDRLAETIGLRTGYETDYRPGMDGEILERAVAAWLEGGITLEEGDRVAVEGGYGLPDGTLVRIVNPEGREDDRQAGDPNTVAFPIPPVRPGTWEKSRRQKGNAPFTTRNGG